ncbi:MAG: hypothetical protein RLZZ77_210 [Bacteroidota bacterium]|jgi:hypothetical protein
MGLFDFFKRKRDTEQTLEQVIRDVMDDIPDVYRTNALFIESEEFFYQQEWGVTIDSLIQLASDSGHFFSDHFWLGLADAAQKIDRVEQANHCIKQVEITKSQLVWKLSKGSTVNKVDDSHFESFYSKRVLDSRDNDRRKKDKLNSFINQDGFHIKEGDREATIYYISKGRVCEIFCELSGSAKYDILIGLDHLDAWALPTKEYLSDSERLFIETELKQWLYAQGIKADL